MSKGELGLLKKSGYSEKVIELYVDMTNFGVIENPDIALDYIGRNWVVYQTLNATARNSRSQRYIRPSRSMRGREDESDEGKGSSSFRRLIYRSSSVGSYLKN